MVPATLDLAAATESVTEITVVDDGSSTTNWPNRFSWLFKPSGGIARLVQYVNEYGELRLVSAKTNTVPFRIFGKTAAADAAHTVNLIEVQDARDTRVNVFTVATDGTVAAPNVQDGVVTWPTGSEPSLTGVPDGTLWVEYTP